MKNYLMIVLMLTFVYTNTYSQHTCTLPASPEPTQLAQPNGELIDIKIKGNRDIHYLETMDGYVIMKDPKDNTLKYMISDKNGDLLLTDIVVSNTNNRSSNELNFLNQIDKHLRYSGKTLEQRNAVSRALKSADNDDGPDFIFPPDGVRRALLLLIDFPDQNSVNTNADFDNLANQVGYNVNGQTGSFRDYYLDASYGELVINTDVNGWYRANNNRAFYGGNGANGRDVRPRELVREAVDAAEADGVDFSVYDGDEDGIVDVVMVIHSGRGEESSADADDIWSHRWVLSGQQVTYDGVVINDYIIQPERARNTIANIGVLCHEFGHALGLPDLYDTDGSSSGIGNWGLMAGGTWNNGGRTPAQMCAWAKARLGWINPTVLDAPTAITDMLNLDVSPTCYRVNTDNPNEYFLISNRQKVGWDAHIPGEGLAIWHIDDNQSNNQDENRYWVNLEQADGLNSLNNGAGRGDAGDLFPGSTNNATFNDETMPNAQTYDGNNTGICIRNITESGSTVDFDFGCEEEVEINGLQATYYDNINFTGTTLERVDPTIDFEWGSGSPDPTIGNDTYSARWEGFVETPTSGAYTFTTRSDDGVRLWINGQLIISKWVNQAPREWSGTINMTAGQRVSIQMEYFENGGGAVAQLFWAAPGLAKQIVPTTNLFREGTTTTTCDAPQNLAIGKNVTQSSQLASIYSAEKAVDGNTAGNSFSHTQLQQSPWLTIDLGEVADISTIKIFNRTNCCSERLSNFHVFVSDTPFQSDDISATMNQSGMHDFHFEGTASAITDFDINQTGRYVRVQLTGTNYLQLAEVQVFGCPIITPPACDDPQNIALGKTATQSSEYFNLFPAQKAVDGNTNGNDFSHTQSGQSQWWTLDLEERADISTIKIFNRTNCCSDRLSDFYVFVSDTPFMFDDFSATINQVGVSAYFFEGAAPAVSDFEIERAGRYVRVQLTGINYLQLAEVQVFGCFNPIEAIVSEETLAPTFEEETSELSARLYPNPASNQVNLELRGLGLSLEQEMTVQIYALDGRKVYQDNVNVTGLLQIDLESLPTGQMYFLHLATEDGRMFREKFLKM